MYSSSHDLARAYERLELDKAVERANKVLILKFANTWLAKGITKVAGFPGQTATKHKEFMAKKK